MNQVNSYYLIIFILTIIFSLSIYLIKFTSKNNDEENNLEKYMSFILPTTTIVSFFISCYYVSKVLIIGKNIKYFGIIFIILISIILIYFNHTILSDDKIKKYIKGKKFSISGMIIVLGISSLLFGFIDNFGLKLGIEALDNTFLNILLGPFSTDKRFANNKKSIAKNLKFVNNWANGKWRSIINQTLRFKDDIKKINNPKINDLVEDIEGLIKEGGKPLEIPNDVKSKDLTFDYIQNIKRKYDMIEGSKAMMGNAFSNIIGSLLSAALINLFTYMTKYDSTYSGDEKIDENKIVKKIKTYLPVIEAFFIGIGCIIPIILNIAMTQDNFNYNNKIAWSFLGIIGLGMLILMFLSVKNSKNMTEENKKKSISKTLKDIEERLDIKKDDILYLKIEKFIKNL